MKIGAISRGKLGKLTDKLLRHSQSLEGDIASLEEERVTLAQQSKAKREELSTAELHAELLRQARVLLECGEGAYPLREKIIRAKARVGRDDITVKVKRELEETVTTMEKEWQSHCPHPLVVQTVDCYGGSYSNDYEDGHHALRVCAFCGLQDSSASSSDPTCKVLSENPDRIVTRAFHLRQTPLITVSEETQRWRPDEVNLWLPIETIVDSFFDDRISKLAKS